MADHEIGAILTLRDNMSGVLRGVRREQVGFRQDTMETQRVVREPMEMRVNVANAAKAIAGIGLAAGAAVLAAGGLAVAFGDDLQKSLNGVQAATGVADEAMGAVKSTMIEIYNDNFGENFEEIGAAMATVTQQTGLTGNALKKVTEDGLALKDTFGLEVVDSVKSANQMMKSFGMDAGTAYNLMAQGARGGLNASGDLLETLNEYSPTFAAQGFSSEEMFNMLGNASKAGIKDLDVAADAIKEFGIRSKDGSKTSAEGFEALGLNAASMTKAFAAGGDEAKGAFDKTTKALLAMDDPAKQNAAGTALMGTQWEDLGVKGVTALVNTQGAINASTDALKEINAVKYNTFGEAMEGIKRKLLTGILLPIDEKITPSLNAFAGWITTNMPKIQNEISYAFNAAGSAITSLKENLDIIVPAIAAVTAAFVAQAVISKVKLLMDAYKAATVATTTVQWLLNAAMAANPFGIAAVAIGLLVAGGVLLYQNWDTVKEKASDVWVTIKNAFKTGVNGAIDLINGLIGAINKIPGVNVPLIAHVQMSKTTAEQVDYAKKNYTDNWAVSGHNALGTDNWRGGPTWVGERGPELLNLPRGSQIIPNHKVLDQTQDIKQNVIPFESKKATDLIQNVRQLMLPARPDQPESLSQNIKQNVIPFDGYIAKLNKGDGVQTASENPYNGGGSAKNKGNKTISIAKLADQIIVREESDIDRMADALVRKIEHAAFNMA